MRRERVPSFAWQRDVPESIRSLSDLANPDYLDLFTATTNEASGKPAEDWARAVLEGGPGYLRLGVFVAQRLVLGLRLGPRRSPDYIHGWKIAKRDHSWIRIEGASWMVTTCLVFKVDEARLSMATFICYDRWMAALVWPPVSIVHRKVGLALMRRALMNDLAAIANLTLDQFKDAYLIFLAAFNRRDLVTAFAVLAPNCEFRTPPDMPDHQVLVGREQVIAFFEQAFEVLRDWHIDSVHILQAADDVFVALDQGRVSGRSGDAPTVQEIATVSELRDSMVIRVQQYTSWEEGLRASGLDPSISADGLNPSGETG